MPLYTYVCKDCGEKFDLLVGVVAEKEELKCKKCESKNIRKAITSFGINTSSDGGASSSSCPTCSTGTCPTCFSP